MTSKTLIAFLILCASTALGGMPKYTAFRIGKSDLDPPTKAIIKSEIKGMGHYSPVNWPVNPFEGAREVYYIPNPSREGWILIFLTHRLLGRWIGKDAVRTGKITQAKLDAWWDAHRTKLATRKAAMIARVNKPTFGITAKDTIPEIMAHIESAFVEVEGP